MMSRLFFVCIFCSLSHLVPAQERVYHQTRYELEVDQFDDDLTIIPMGEDGLALVRNGDRVENGKKGWEFILLDRDLNEVYKTGYSLEAQYRFIGYDYQDGTLYALYRVGEDDSHDLYVIELDATSHALKNYRIRHQFNIKLTHFFAIDHNIVFGGYINEEPSILIYEANEDRLKVVPGFFLKEGELLDLKANTNHTFNTLMIERSNVGVKLMSRTFDPTGILLLEDVIEVPDNISILTGLTSGLTRDELLITGLFGSGNGKLAIGFYTVMVDPFQDQEIQVHHFARMERFLDYMGTKRAERTRQKERGKLQSGKPSSLRIMAQPIRIVEQEKGFLLLSEAYLATTNLNQSPYWGNPGNSGNPSLGYSPYYNRYYSPYTNFSNTNTIRSTEVKMLESVVTLFDGEGDLEWDQSLPMNELKLPYLDQSSDFTVMNDKVTMIFKNESDLFIKSVYMNSDKIENDTVKLKPRHEGDILNFEREGNAQVRHWYANNFYVQGYQSVKHAEQKGTSTRFVFYITKVEVPD